MKKKPKAEEGKEKRKRGKYVGKQVMNEEVIGGSVNL